MSTLAEKLSERGAPLPVELAAYLALEVCEALLRKDAAASVGDVLVGRAGDVRLARVHAGSPAEAARAARAVFEHLAGDDGRSSLLEMPRPDPSPEALRTHLAATLFPLTRDECRATLAPLLERLERDPNAPAPSASGPIEVGWGEGEHEVAAGVDEEEFFASIEAASRAAARRDPAPGRPDPLLDLSDPGRLTPPLTSRSLRKPADLSPTLAPPRPPSAPGKKQRPALSEEQIRIPNVQLPGTARHPSPEGPGPAPADARTSWEPPRLENLPSQGRFERYDLLGLVAVGGMAQIFLARERADEGIERLVALKRLLPHLASEPSFRRMFADEARLGFRLRHPNVCTVSQYGQIDEVPYLVLEWVHGLTLAKLVSAGKHRGGVPFGVAARIVGEVASALDYAHRSRDAEGRPLRIVHRDVSPQNVMVSFDGFVKLLDFGVAKAAAQGQRTDGGMVKGKYGYMSPEQCLGLPLDGRSDVFSLGICLYELVTGAHLYHHENLVASVQSILNDPVPDPRGVRPDVPAPLAEAIRTALHKHPEERFASASEFRLALARFLQTLEEPITEGHVGHFVRGACATQEAPVALDRIPRDLRTSLRTTGSGADPGLDPSTPGASAGSPPEPEVTGGAAASRPDASGEAVAVAPREPAPGGSGPLEGGPRADTSDSLSRSELDHTLPLDTSDGPQGREGSTGRAAPGPGDPAGRAETDRSPPRGRRPRDARPLAWVAAVGGVVGLAALVLSRLAPGTGAPPDDGAPEVAPAAGPAARAAPSADTATADAPPPGPTPIPVAQEAARPAAGRAAATTPEPPPAVDPTAPGALLLETVPTEGAVRLDGELLSERTPIRFDALAPGVHDVLVSKSGYRPTRRRIRVEPGGEARVVIELRRRRR